MFRQGLQSLRRTALKTIAGGTVVVGAIEVTTHLPSEGRSSALYHSIADDVVTPSLRKVCSPEHAHDLAIQILRDFPNLVPTFRPSAKEQQLNVAVTLFGKGDVKQLTFHNPIGLAAGFDKDGVAIQGLLDLGFGFVEIGSVTLHPQPGNPSPRMFRLTENQAIINRYGFNSVGADVVEEHLKAFRLQQQQQTTKRRSGLLGINLGLNKTSTTPIDDYQALIRQLGPYADYLVINVSSPNTPGLRDLQFSLEQLLTACLTARNELKSSSSLLPPLLVKLSPDLTDQQLLYISQVLQKVGIDGIILTNTTTQRPNSLIGESKTETGGLSGRPLRDRSTECVCNLYEWTNGSIPIIGVGGIFTPQDVEQKLRAGASVVQVYSGMVYGGPGTVSKLRRGLAEWMCDNGHRQLQQNVVGIDHEELYWSRLKQRQLKRQGLPSQGGGVDETANVSMKDPTTQAS